MYVPPCTVASDTSVLGYTQRAARLLQLLPLLGCCLADGHAAGTVAVECAAFEVLWRWWGLGAFSWPFCNLFIGPEELLV